VAPDGTRTRVQRGRELGVQAVVRVGGDAFLVNDADNLEAYSTMRLVRGGRTVGRWSAYGAIVVGRDGAVGFGEATFSEADRRGPTALHLMVDGQHRVQLVRQHPDVRAIVDEELVFEYRYATDGNIGPFITDLVSAPRPSTRAVTGHTYDETAREPDGAMLSIEGTGARSAIVRTRRDGTRERATPLRRALPMGSWTAYCLELQVPS
jgi:hypothetical protein